MGITIAVAGKGSAGKTTLVPSLLAAARASRPWARHLVVDIDPHQSLTTLLGHGGCPTVARLRSAYERELLTGAALREDETREAFLEARMGQEALLAADGYDFLSLGQWELAGSQCTPNRVMERALGSLLDHYDLALLDNEAGVEHIGRYAGVPLTAMVIVATPERLSLDVAGRIATSAAQLRARPQRMYVLLNRVRAGDLGKPHVVDALDQLDRADVRFVGAVSEADGEPHTLAADHPWHGQLAPLWRTVLGQARAAAVIPAILANGYRLTLRGS